MNTQGDTQRKAELEMEMSRFEQEISEHPAPPRPPVISANTFRLASQAIQQAVPPVSHMAAPQVQPAFQTHQELRPSAMPPRVPLLHGGAMQRHIPRMSTPGVVQMGAAMPMAPHGIPSVMPQGAMAMMPVPMAGPTQMVPTNPSARPKTTITAEEKKEWESTYAQAEGGGKEKKKKDKKFLRVAGGQVWEDTSLGDWESDDFRIFCGDLGNEVTDDQLTRAFSKYPSFLKAKVVRDKKSSKTKGYGFVSFKDPNDFIRAMREMNGKYVGNRPIKLRKSTWRDRNVEIVKKKAKEKKRLGLR